MTTMLNMPRAITVPFSGAGVMAHPVLKQFNGQVLKLHAGLNTVVDDVAQHPLLRMFIVDERVAAPVAPLVPIAGPVAPPVHQPQPEPLNATAAMLSHANEPDADKQALERATEAAKAEYERLLAMREAAEKDGQALPAVDAAQQQRDADVRVRAAQAGAAPGATAAPAPAPAATEKPAPAKAKE